MTEEMRMDVDPFFQVVGSGSVDELKKLIADNQLDETSQIANSFNELGETPLIVAIKGNHLEMVRFLVRDLKVNCSQLGRFTWKELDYEEAPPLFAAIMCDRTQNIIRLLIDEELAANESPATLDSISSSARLSRPQKIDILELVGAVYILKKDCDFKSLEFAVRFWYEAQCLRRSDGGNPIPKTPLSLSECARKVFGNTSEFSTDDELEHILDNPFDHLGLIRSEYHLQTLLMIQRILSQIHVDPLPFFLHRLFTFGHSVSGSSFNKQKTIERWTFYSFPAIRTKK